MTDNRTTELLRKLLEERGLSCQTNYLHASWCVGPKLYDAVDNLDGTLTVDNLTPEQAIAATMGKPEIVRCGDCKYGYRFEQYGEERWQCANPYQDGDDVKPDAYCWRGERKEVD